MPDMRIKVRYGVLMPDIGQLMLDMMINAGMGD